MLLPDEGLERVYISFYIDEMANDVIYDKETETAWHRVILHVIENH